MKICRTLKVAIFVGALFSSRSLADLDETDLESSTASSPIPVSGKRKSDGTKSESIQKREAIRPDLNGDEEKKVSDTVPDVQPTEAPKSSNTVSKKSNSSTLRAAPEDPEKARKEPVKLKSKGLKAHKDSGYVELTESVQLTQANLKMNSDYAKVFLDKNTNEVSRAEILGNVHIEKESSIETERITADADRAQFSNAERKIVLQGNASLLKDGALLRGKKIIYDLTTGWITFEGAEGVMQQGQESKTKK